LVAFVSIAFCSQYNTIRLKPVQYEALTNSNTAAIAANGGSSICTTNTTLKIVSLQK